MILNFILLLTSAFMLGMGFVFTWIDLRTPMGPQSRYFATQLVIFPIAVIVDQIFCFSGLHPKVYLILNQLFHCMTLVFILNAIYFMSKASGKTKSPIFWVFATINIVLFPLIFTHWIMYLDMNSPAKVPGGLLYPFVFIPYAIFFVSVMYYFLINQLKNASKGQRKFPALHLVAWVTISGAGLLNIYGEAFPIPNMVLIAQTLPLSLLLFGFMCAYFFSEQFFSIQFDRNQLFRRLSVLTSDLDRMRPLEKIGESASFISHEIKNYVSVVRSNNLLLQTKLQGGSDHEEMERISRSVDRLEQFTRSILDFSSSNKETAVEKLNLMELVRAVIAASFLNQTESVRIQAQSLPTILGDKPRLEQMFLNLLKNSFEAGADKIEIRFGVEDSLIIVWLEDNGSGCSAEEVAQLGSPFFTTKRDRGGTGLGLAISKAIIQGHGGTLEVTTKNDSRSGDYGMKFRLAFPALDLNASVKS